jgi:hypothetical protein
MSLTHSGISIAMPRATSAGASQTRSIKRWIPDPFSAESSEATRSVFASVHDHPGVRFKFELESTGESPVFMPEDVLLRVLCHVILERLPADAIRGVWENVYDAWEWHLRPRLPAPPESYAHLPAVTRVFSVVEEPPFRILEE